MAIDQTAILKQIDKTLELFKQLRSGSKYDDCSDLPDEQRLEVSIRLQSALKRLAPPGSTYLAALQELVGRYGSTSLTPQLKNLPGVLKALRADYAAGYTRAVEELIHAAVFSDFLEMAEHLLEESFKDPAAVLAGGVLEEHLRHLCDRNGVSTAHGGRPKKAEAMNTELAGIPAYSKLDQKSITAWLDLRNRAAHGRYTEYDGQQVGLMIHGIRDFMARVPAA